MNTGSAKVAVVIINYNGRAFVDELLASLQEQTLSGFKTFLIDNGSSDDTAGHVRARYPGVSVWALPSNCGFAAAGNLGFRRVEADYVALLNTDMRVEPGWLEGLVAAVEQSGDIAAVASKLRLYDEPEKLNGVGGAMNFLGYSWDRGMFEVDAGQYDEPADVLFASAGAALFRRSFFLQAGGFDELFFMYHEDVDLCWRFWLLGLRVVTAPRAVAYHYFGGSTRTSRGMLWREVLGERNNIRSLIKNYEKENSRRALKQLLLLRQRVPRKLAQLRNFAWNLAQLPDSLAWRRWVQDNRRRSDAEIAHLIVQSPHVPIRL